ncbi:MAG: PBECR4 domain-containing protein [Lachnospiraceae bacterium]
MTNISQIRSGKKVYSYEEIIIQLTKSAVIYNNYVDKDILFVYFIPTLQEYKHHIVSFRKSSFAHLTGFNINTRNSTSKSAFFERCLDNNLDEEYLVQFTHNKKTVSQKLSVLPSLLNYHNCSIYRIGQKDTITQYNKFQVGLIYTDGLLGFSNSSCDYHNILFPTTTMLCQGSDYITEPYRISLVFEKNAQVKMPYTLVYAIKKGLAYQDLKPELPQDLLNIIVCK